MKKLYSILGAFAVAISITADIGLAQQASSAAATPRQVVVPEDVLNPLVEEPERHFHRAASLFAKGDLQGAVSEVRASAALLRLEAGRESAEARSELLSSASELNDLADRVEHGKVSSRRELDLAFAHADLALAAHYRAMAAKAIANQQRDDAGRWLKAAANSVDGATRWTGQKPPTAQAEAWDQVHALEAKIHSGADWSYDEAKKGIGYLGTQIQYLGSKMEKFTSSPTPGNPVP